MKISGGDKLDRELAKIAAQLKGERPTLKVGFLSNATYPDGTPVALVAAIHEFGSKKQNIPPRPFFRHAIAKNKSGWPKLIKAALQARKDARSALLLVGQVVKEQIQESIREANFTPLSERTVQRKGHDRQLIDTGHMLNSVDYEVS